MAAVLSAIGARLSCRGVPPDTSLDFFYRVIPGAKSTDGPILVVLAYVLAIPASINCVPPSTQAMDSRVRRTGGELHGASVDHWRVRCVRVDGAPSGSPIVAPHNKPLQRTNACAVRPK